MIPRNLRIAVYILAALVPLFVAVFAPKEASASFFIGGETRGSYNYRCCGVGPTNYGNVTRVRFSELLGGNIQTRNGLMWVDSARSVMPNCFGSTPKIFIGIGYTTGIGNINVVVPFFGMCMERQGR